MVLNELVPITKSWFKGIALTQTFNFSEITIFKVCGIKCHKCGIHHIKPRLLEAI